MGYRYATHPSAGEAIAIEDDIIRVPDTAINGLRVTDEPVRQTPGATQASTSSQRDKIFKGMGA